MQLRDYQSQVIKDIYGNFRRGKRRCLVMAPTGSGKSLMIAQVVKDALSKNKRVLILVHRQKLVNQLKETIKAMCGNEPTIIAPKHKLDAENPVILAMAQTLHRRELPPNIDILIADEAHITSYMTIFSRCLDQYCGSIWSLSKAFVIGFTATPWRMQNKQSFCHLFDCIAKAPTTRELIKLGYLTNPRIFSYSILDSTKLKTDSSGDYSVSSLAKTCNEDYNRDVVSKWRSQADKLKTIIFCSSVAQAESLFGIISPSHTVKLVLGSTSESDRETIFEDFKTGVTQVLVTVSVLTEGYDETSIECVVIARPTRSPALLQQMIGRGLRLHKGKEEVLIIDCGECINWITTSTLKGNVIADPIDISAMPMCPIKKPLLKIQEKACLECREMIPIYARLCPHCESPVAIKEKYPPSLIEFPDLVEYFTAKAKKEYEFIRKFMNTAFNDLKDPSNVFEVFHSKYGYLPPKDWFLGAIFDLNTSYSEYAYRHYLENRKVDAVTTDFFCDLEFGVTNRVYRLPNGLTHERLHYESVGNYWLSLGYSTKDQLDTIYAKELVKTTNLKVLNYFHQQYS